MAGALREIVASMMGGREGVLPSTQSFPPLDVGQIARGLAIEAQAEEAGKANRPPNNGDSEDTTELAIFAEMERRHRKASEEFESQLELYEGRIRRALISTDQRTSIEAAGESALTDLRIQAIDDLNHLHTSRDEVEGRAAELLAFRQENQLNRLPIVVSSRARVLRSIILLIFVMLESYVNGSFFAEGSEQGLIGGFTQALALSILNVGGAVIYSLFGLPLLVHSRRMVKSVGVVALLVYAVWVVVLNLLVAHFRDLFIAHQGAVAVSDMWNRLRSAPFVLDEVRSYLLALLGVGLSICALIDAAGMDDAYLGYGEVGRRHADAVREYADEKTRRLAELTRLRNDAVGGMSKVIELTRTLEFELRLALEGRLRLVKSFEAFLDHLADSYRQLIGLYREANVRARSDASPPRFDRPVTRPPFLAAPDLSPLPDLGEDSRKHVIERMEYFIQAINRQFEQEVGNYQTISSLTHSDPRRLVNP